MSEHTQEAEEQWAEHEAEQLSCPQIHDQLVHSAKCVPGWLLRGLLCPECNEVLIEPEPWRGRTHMTKREKQRYLKRAKSSLAQAIDSLEKAHEGSTGLLREEIRETFQEPSSLRDFGARIDAHLDRVDSQRRGQG